jgi:hypothetical protein
MTMIFAVFSIVVVALLARKGSTLNNEAARAEAWARFEIDFR